MDRLMAHLYVLCGDVEVDRYRFFLTPRVNQGEELRGQTPGTDGPYPDSNS